MFMKKVFVFLFMTVFVAMTAFTSCSKDDEEATEQVEDFASLAPKLVFKSGWVEMRQNAPYLCLSTKSTDGKSDGVECEISFMSKSVEKTMIRIGEDDMVDLTVRYRKGGAWTVLKVGKGYPWEIGNEGFVALSWKNKSASIYNVNLAIPELGYEGKVVARNITFDISTTITLP